MPDSTLLYFLIGLSISTFGTFLIKLLATDEEEDVFGNEARFLFWQAFILMAMLWPILLPYILICLLCKWWRNR
jgi:hypothetical protein